jgi:outer membrane lipoprotein LolB
MSNSSFRPGLALLLFTTLLLQACAARRGLELPDLPDWDTRRAVLEAQEQWEFAGRIGASAGDEGFNGKLRWRQHKDEYSATVSGPLGVGTVRIEGNGDHVTLTDKQGETTELTDAELDLRLRYGWTIPVDSLRFWALGIPDPSVPTVTRFGDNGLIDEMQQGDWLVVIAEYRDGGGQPMPRRITAVNADAKVRLVIDKWTFY